MKTFRVITDKSVDACIREGTRAGLRHLEVVLEERVNSLGFWPALQQSWKKHLTKVQAALASKRK